MAMRYPSPGGREAYWLEAADDASQFTIGKGERRVLEVDPAAGVRIVRILDHLRDGILRQLSFCCHDLIEYVFDEPGNFRRLKVVPPRGDVIGPDEAVRRYRLPCGIQFRNAAYKGGPVFHSAVLLGIDHGAGTPDALPADRAVVLHKPGSGDMEIVTLQRAVERYADRVREIAYYGHPR